MYFSIGIVIFALLISVVVCTGRKRAAIKRICSMTPIQKCETLHTLIEPFGYCYDSSQDIITSHNQAWQREYGYSSLFDFAAPHFNMVFDWLPVYFDYRGRTWLIEFWKGQYGINTGAEIGVYYADRTLSVKERRHAHFEAVSDEDMLHMAMCLSKGGSPIATVSRRTWWLTAFSMGCFSRPKDLFLNVSITFQSCEMLHCFLQALLEQNFPKHCIQVCNMQVHIQFAGFTEQHFSCFQKLARWWSQCTSHFYCKLFLLITRFFCLTVDRLLYLYYLLPGCFRRTLRLRRYKGHKNKKYKYNKSK